MADDSDGDAENGDDAWTRLYGMAVAGVVAVVGLATLTSAGIGSPVTRVVFSVLLGVFVGQAAKAL